MIVVMKPNLLAENCTATAQKQLAVSWEFRLPRLRQIRKYRRLYNSVAEPRLRSQFNVPLPVFAGMIDTLQADLDDSLILKFENQDPADWKAAQKANVALQQQSESMRPEAQWDKKFRQARQECVLTGRGILKFGAYHEDNSYFSSLEVVPFEDFFFEPLGGGNLEAHLFCGQQNVWRTKTQLKEGADNGIYDKRQVALLTESEGGQVKMAGIWDGMQDIGNRFAPLGLNPEANNYVGESVYNLCEWVLNYQGRRWYLVFDAYSGIWIRFEKLTDVASNDYLPWMSFASHEDAKNFASKAFADDLYPVADSIITLFNQDLTNRQKRNLNAKAFDKEMFKDVGKLDEAQYRPDALVPVDTKNGTRRISDGIFAFETPVLTGTVDLIGWLQEDTGKLLGVTDLQQGAAQSASKAVGVTYAELGQVSKRLSYMSQPFIEVGQQLGMRFFGSLKDYMKEPMAIKMFGEDGIEWDVLRRTDLSTKKDFEISITSKSRESKANDMAKQNKEKALTMTAQSPYVNGKVRDEMILRDIGNFDEFDVAMLLDTSSDTDKETQAEASASIQEIVLRGKMPKENWNADAWFIRHILEFAKKHHDTLPMKKYMMLIDYANMHQQIAMQNMQEKAVNDVKQEQQQMANDPAAQQMQEQAPALAIQ